MLIIWTERQQKPCLRFLKQLATLLIQFCVFETEFVPNSIIKHHDFCEKYSNRDIRIFELLDENRLKL